MAKLFNLSITAVNLKIHVVGGLANIEADSITIKEDGETTNLDSKIGSNPGECSSQAAGSVPVKQRSANEQAGEGSEDGEVGNPGHSGCGSERGNSVVTGRLPDGMGAGLPGSSQPDLHISISAPEGLVDSIAEIVTDAMCKLIPGMCVDSKGN